LELNDPTDGKVLKHTYTWCIFWEWDLRPTHYLSQLVSFWQIVPRD
jgi:hypothetical protein